MLNLQNQPMKSLSFTVLALLFIAQQLAYTQNYPSTTWETVKSPTFYGWDQSMLDALEAYTIDSTATTAMMIIQDGRIIYEYGNTTENSYIASCRKSILAMLYGKYVTDGTINLNKSLEELGITYDGRLLPTEKKATVKDIISSRSGIYLPSANPGDMVHLAPKRGSVKAGELWVYNNWDFNTAGYIFEQETQKNIYDEIDAQFAQPMQMQDWDRARQHKDGDLLTTDILAYHMDFSARDMARLGLLLLNKGKWMDKQLIPASWVDEMTKASTSVEEVDKIAPFLKNEFTNLSYGYMWWLWETPKHKALKGAYSAQGAWGQNITVIPATNTVVVIKTNNVYERQKGDHYFMIDQIAQAYKPLLSQELKELAIHLNQNDIDQFIKNYKQIAPTTAGVDYQTIINQLAYHYLNERKEYEKAFDLFRLNVNQHPKSWLVYDGLAEAYFLLGNYAEAIKNYQKAIDLNTNNQWENNERATFIIERIAYKLKSSGGMRK